jgi:hypothetical protein
MIKNNQMPEEADFPLAVSGQYKDNKGQYISLSWVESGLVCEHNDVKVPLYRAGKNYFIGKDQEGYRLLFEYKNKKARKIVIQVADQINFYDKSDLVAGQ